MKIQGVLRNGRRYQIKTISSSSDYRVILKIMYAGVFKTENVFISSDCFEKALLKAEQQTGIKLI